MQFDMIDLLRNIPAKHMEKTAVGIRRQCKLGRIADGLPRGQGKSTQNLRKGFIIRPSPQGTP